MEWIYSITKRSSTINKSRRFLASTIKYCHKHYLIHTILSVCTVISVSQINSRNLPKTPITEIVCVTLNHVITVLKWNFSLRYVSCIWCRWLPEITCPGTISIGYSIISMRKFKKINLINKTTTSMLLIIACFCSTQIFFVLCRELESHTMNHVFKI